MEQVTFEVNKITTATRFCSKCQGTRIDPDKRRFKVTCTRCRGTGKESIKHQTTVSLIEALRELGLIK